MQKAQDSAETLALQVLGWLVGDEDLMPVFQGSTGVSEADIRARADDPLFLGAVLDFLMMDDQWVIQACDAQSLSYDQVALVRHALPGGADMHWT